MLKIGDKATFSNIHQLYIFFIFSFKEMTNWKKKTNLSKTQISLQFSGLLKTKIWTANNIRMKLGIIDLVCTQT